MLAQKYKDFSSWIVYQIYPRSFMDSNHDGIGDLGGILQKLDYLKDLGINAIWICPCYKSPNVDNGYDVEDYRDIMDEFGTMDDMKTLIAAAHERGIRVIMDLVPNHTSDQHRWFLESKKSRDNEYSDYYYWFDEIPNDWQSTFFGSAYEYCEERGQYYLHSYAIGQPDLNWTNPKVVKEMQDVVDFWVDLGVDGFRIDVIDQISKDFNGRNALGPHLHEYIQALFGREKTAHLFTVGECTWGVDMEEVKRHCAAERNELTTLFQFEHITLGRDGKYVPKKQSLKELRDILVYWQTIADENDLLYSLFTDNHDQPQYVSRMGNEELRYESATCIASMLYTLRGIPFIYQGQEYGSLMPHYDRIEDFDDIECIRHYHEEVPEIGEEAALVHTNFGSRDNTRRPMCWDGSEFGGFSTVQPWITPHSRLQEINLQSDKAADKSVFRFYQALLKLRRETPAILYGSLKVLSSQDDPFFMFEREYEGDKLTIVCNFEEPSRITVPEGEVVLANSENQTDAFAPYEVRIVRYQ